MNILVQIPVDLIVQILSKLPAKSIARFRCVSKEWNSNLRNAHFTDLFFKVSSSRHHLLFAVLKSGKWHYYSAPEPMDPHMNSSPLIADYHMCFPLIPCNTSLHVPINGLSCTDYIRFKRGSTESKIIISNPSTGQCIPIPVMRGRIQEANTFFGYDPINKEYKLLRLSIRKTLVIEHEVLTLRTEKPTWNRICSLSLQFSHSPICINGVLYYLGTLGSRETHGRRVLLVCFDVRSEKFKFIETSDKVRMFSRLIRYKGKVAIVRTVESFYGKTRSLELLVLNDVEKTEWSQHIYVLPPLWKDLVADMALQIVGMTSNGELVLSSYWYSSFHIFFLNVEKNTIARVRVHGIESKKTQRIQTFIDYVENVKFI